VSKKFYLCGRLLNARTQHILKAIDYQNNKEAVLKVFIEGAFAKRLYIIYSKSNWLSNL